MVRVIQRPAAETSSKPSYCVCPHCKNQIVFFYSNPVMCSSCAQPLEIKYLDLLKSVGYRLEFHFKEW